MLIKTSEHTFTGSRIKNFTLVELMVVMAIIIILIAMLMPALQKAREKTKQIACVNNLKQGGLGLMAYANDYKGILPRLIRLDGTVVDCNTNSIEAPNMFLGGWVGFGQLYKLKYIESGRILYCPSDTGTGFGMTSCLGSSATTLISSYMYRDNCEWNHCKLYDISQKAAWGWLLASDNFTSPQRLFHKNSVNILFADGRVKMWQNGEKGAALMNSLYSGRLDYFTQIADLNHYAGY